LELIDDVGGDSVPGDYTHFTLVKENWDTMRALKETAKRTGVSRNRYSFAGTKDRRAITAQRVSAYKVPIEKLRALDIKDIVLKDFGYSDENLGLGAFLRRRGLHEAQLRQWREAALKGLSDKRPSAPRSQADKRRIRELERELRRKEKALAETAALLVLQKKIQARWGDGEDGTNGKNG